MDDENTKRDMKGIKTMKRIMNYIKSLLCNERVLPPETTGIKWVKGYKAWVKSMNKRKN